jgi:hypothetical protein
MEHGYITLLLFFCINEAVTAGIVFYLIREKRNQQLKAEELRSIIFETYRNKYEE